jgi:hypothetical protein
MDEQADSANINELAALAVSAGLICDYHLWLILTFDKPSASVIQPVNRISR